MAIRVLIAEPSPLICLGLKHVLAGKNDVEIVGETSIEAEITPMVSEIRPDILIIGPGFTAMSVEETIRDFRKKRIKCKMLVIGGQREESNGIAWLKVWIKVYLQADDKPEMFIDAIQSVAKDDIWLSPSICSILMKGISSSKNSKYNSLTDREKEILRWMVAGLTNKEISLRLCISESTVEFHVGQILRKLGVSRRVEAAVWASE